MTDSPGSDSTGRLTTDPPRPPGTPDVDELVGDPAAEAAADTGGPVEPPDEDVTEEGDPAAPEPPD
jgi:hypothetical protein